MAKHILVLIFSLLMLTTLGCKEKISSVGKTNAQDNNQTEQRKALPRIVIITPMSHPALNRSIDGFKDALAEEGFTPENTALEELNANGDFSKIAYLTKKAVQAKPNIIFVLTTPAGSTAINITNPNKVPLVYTAVTDPVGAGLVTGMDHSDTYATGVSDRYPVQEQVSFFKRIYPEMKKVGVLYSSGEENSRILSDLTMMFASQQSIQSNEYVISDPGKISFTVKTALENNDAIIINGDNQLIENLEAIVKLAITYRKPIFVGDTDSVKRGAVATVGPSYYDLGLKTGRKAVQILRGADVRGISSEHPTEFDYIINFDAARAMGVEVSKEVFSVRRIWEATAFSNK